LDPKTSRRIFELARDQQDELQSNQEEEATAHDEQMEGWSRPRDNDNDSHDEDDETDDDQLDFDISLNGELAEEEFVRCN